MVHLYRYSAYLLSVKQIIYLIVSKAPVS